MPQSLLDAICAYVRTARPLSNAEAVEAALAFEDTLAVTLAGWATPVARAARTAVAAGGLPLIDGGAGDPPETAAFVHAVAGHALDYDDVHLPSVTHPSVVIIPALLAMTARAPAARSNLLVAYGIGLSVTAALGEALGFEHYARGWHATSTIGPLAATAAIGRLLDFDEPTLRSALALSAAQSGGLQRNFGSMAKPVQAGNAAAAAVRAAGLAMAGVGGDQDILGPKGFLDLYGDAGAADRSRGIELHPQFETLSRKLYPCCYANHRPIAAALELHARLGGPPRRDAHVAIQAPFATMQPLRVTNPASGREGQFCAAYVVAAGLIHGEISLNDFTDEAVRRAPVRALMARTRVSIDPGADPLPSGLDNGSVRVQVLDSAGGVLGAVDVAAFPGSPSQPATADQIAMKSADCLAGYGADNGRTFSLEDFHRALRRELGAA